MKASNGFCEIDELGTKLNELLLLTMMMMITDH